MPILCEPVEVRKVGGPAREPLVEVLPAPPGAKPGAIRWTPATPGAGRLEIAAGRCRCEYRVEEYCTPWHGRAVRMTKAPGQAGSDAGEAAYDVYVGLRNPDECRCDCKGHVAHGHCKHVDALRALLSNSWLDLFAAEPDTDVGATEQEDQPEPAGFGLTAEEEAARVQILTAVRGAADLAAAVAWLQTPTGRRLTALIGWDDEPAASLAVTLTGCGC